MKFKIAMLDFIGETQEFQNCTKMEVSVQLESRMDRSCPLICFRNQKNPLFRRQQRSGQQLASYFVTDS